MSRTGRLLLVLVVGLAGGWLVRSYVVEAVMVASGSMEPTLAVSAHYFVNRLAYQFQPPRRGDIVVFTSPVDQKTGLIKRVIGLPGDDIEIRQKEVFLNGQKVEEPYVIHKRADVALEGDNIGPMKVPADTVFVLGDNRDESSDSSVWKDPAGQPIHFLPIRNIKGKLVEPL